MTETAAPAHGPLHVAWMADTERVQATDLTHGLLVLPDETGSHRLYFVAPDAETLAQLCALPIAFALETGVWSLACKIVRDNPLSDDARVGSLPPLPPPVAWPVSEAARMRVEALVTAVAAGARSRDGSHVRSLIAARDALLAYVADLERGDG